MSKVKFQWNQDFTNYVEYISGLPERVEAEVSQIIEEEIQLAEEEVIRIINTSGTGYVGKGALATPEARVDTGYMRSQVRSKMIDSHTGRFGWGLEGGAVPDYFLEQENEDTIGGNPPMHAILGAFIQARERFKSRVMRLWR